MYYNVDTQDLLRQIGFNFLVARAHDSHGDASGTLARVTEHSRSNSVIHTGAALYEARSMPALTRVPPIVVGDWVNDVPMFQVAGRSFVMGSAPDAVRAAASDVLASPAGAGGGIAEAIARAWG